MDQLGQQIRAQRNEETIGSEDSDKTASGTEGPELVRQVSEVTSHVPKQSTPRAEQRQQRETGQGGGPVEAPGIVRVTRRQW